MAGVRGIGDRDRIEGVEEKDNSFSLVMYSVSTGTF